MIYIYAARSVKFDVRARSGGIFLYLLTHSLSKLFIGLFCLRLYMRLYARVLSFSFFYVNSRLCTSCLQSTVNKFPISTLLRVALNAINSRYVQRKVIFDNENASNCRKFYHLTEFSCNICPECSYHSYIFIII